MRMETKRSEGTYKAGQFHGAYAKYYANGQIELSIVFKDGQWHGPYISYYSNGNKWLEGFYTNGPRERGLDPLRRISRKRQTGPLSSTTKTGKKNGRDPTQTEIPMEFLWSLMSRAIR